MKTRGEWFGEPKRPRPDLREREKGEGAVEEWEYESLTEGPQEKLDERENER